ncbi:hypothetical protein [Rugosimonospora africana]|nr:hypothetical protein [Rugosimonospora africana]
MNPEPDETRVAFDYRPLRAARNLTRGLAVSVLALAVVGLVVVLLLFAVSWVLGLIVAVPFLAFFGAALNLARGFVDLRRWDPRQWNPKRWDPRRWTRPTHAAAPARPYLLRIGADGLIVELGPERPAIVAWRHVESIDVAGRGPGAALVLRLAPTAADRARPPFVRPFAIRFRDMDTEPARVLEALRRYAAGRVPIPGTPPATS